MHNGRVHKRSQKSFSTKHNDRSFKSTFDEHIDPARSANNFYWHIYKPDTMTFEEAETRFYRETFSDFLQERNEKAKRSRNRQQSMDDYRKSRKSCPEEILLYVGSKRDHADPADLLQIVQEHIRWREEKYPQAKILDYALHVDEQGAPHVHLRQVWIAETPHGVRYVSQTDALEQMKVAPSGKYQEKDGEINQRLFNAKRTYTAECRQHLQETAKRHGYEIETTPREKPEQGRTLAQFQADADEKRAKEAKKEAAAARKDAAAAKRQAQATKARLDAIQPRLAAIEDAAAAAEAVRDVMQRVDEELKRFSLHPSTKSAREAAASTLHQVQDLKSSLQRISERAADLADVPDLADLHDRAQRRLQRTRNAIRRAVEKARTEAKAITDAADEAAEKKALAAVAAKQDQLSALHEQMEAVRRDLDKLHFQKIAEQRERDEAKKARDAARAEQKTAEEARDQAFFEAQGAVELQDQTDALKKEKTALEDEIKALREGMETARAEQHADAYEKLRATVGTLDETLGSQRAAETLHDAAGFIEAWTRDDRQTAEYLREKMRKTFAPSADDGYGYGYSR